MQADDSAGVSIEMRIDVTDQQADYYEYNRTPALQINAVVHSRLTALPEGRCRMDVHIYPEPGHAIAPATHAFLLQSFAQTLKNLKQLMESRRA